MDTCYCLELGEERPRGFSGPNPLCSVCRAHKGHVRCISCRGCMCQEKEDFNGGECASCAGRVCPECGEIGTVQHGSRWYCEDCAESFAEVQLDALRVGGAL
jgi:hypothetical protein